MESLLVSLKESDSQLTRLNADTSASAERVVQNIFLERSDFDPDPAGWRGARRIVLSNPRKQTNAFQRQIPGVKTMKFPVKNLL
ncbi:MAG: hypothetical protein WDM76_03790 [Limisphaerales bacterium]